MIYTQVNSKDKKISDQTYKEEEEEEKRCITNTRCIQLFKKEYYNLQKAEQSHNEFMGFAILLKNFS